jgi:hypothetical protein
MMRGCPDCSRLRLLLSLVPLMLVALPAYSEPAPNVAAGRTISRAKLANWSWQALLTGLKVSAGYTMNYRPGAENEGFYKVTYDGDLLTRDSRSMADQFWTGLEPPRSLDLPEFAVRAEEGALHDGGMLLSLVDRRPVSTALGRGAGGVRRTIGLTQDDKMDRIGISLGVETKPLSTKSRMRRDDQQNAEDPQWLTLGLEFNRAEYTGDTGQDASSGKVTYLAQWSKGLTRSRMPRTYLDALAATFGETCQTSAARAGSLAAAIAEARADSALKVVGTKALADGGTSETAVVSEFRAFANQDGVFPQVLLEIADEGSYAFMGGGGENRLANLLTATLTYHFLQGNQSSCLRACYELGNDKASPTERKNSLTFSFNLEF